ncbi:MAG: hypothetical protein OXD32_03790 [Endozoicomonadaceae bacterium]|nr:hypothetical protein [Endozoicomonadaceae bacterium]
MFVGQMVFNVAQPLKEPIHAIFFAVMVIILMGGRGVVDRNGENKLMKQIAIVVIAAFLALVISDISGARCLKKTEVAGGTSRYSKIKKITPQQFKSMQYACCTGKAFIRKNKNGSEAVVCK